MTKLQVCYVEYFSEDMANIEYFSEYMTKVRPLLFYFT